MIRPCHLMLIQVEGAMNLLEINLLGPNRPLELLVEDGVARLLVDLRLFDLGLLRRVGVGLEVHLSGGRGGIVLISHQRDIKLGSWWFLHAELRGKT